MTGTPEAPPLDGSLYVLPDFADFHAERNPNHPWAIFPSVSDSDVTTISFSEFAESTHRIAHALCPMRHGNEREVVGVLVHCDNILYVALLVGMTRAGMIVRKPPSLAASFLSKIYSLFRYPREILRQLLLVC